VLQPPLLLLSGLGEVSRIGEVILNPFLGPRLKSGVITTDMPLEHDQPIDFGLQAFCESCNKCARECPSGAITAGPKRMFNGYEIWKSDSQKCATYRMTTEGGAMCGRCMKTCPWNLEGLFAEKPFRWAAMTLPKAAPLLSRLDDAVGNGDINPVKKWWWDLALGPDGGYHPTDLPVNTRGLQRDLKIKAEDQTLAVYPAPLAAHPHPFPDPMDREAGIAAYQEMVSAEDYKAGKGPRHVYTNDTTSPVLRVEVTGAEPLSEDITLYTLQRPDRAPLPGWTAGAHIDVVVAPEYLRQYSLCGDPAVRDRYQLAVLREDEGRGGSHLMHRIFTPGRRVFIAPPRNHFPIAEGTRSALLYGGGIGITPMIAMAHTLHRDDVPFQMHYSVPRRARAALWELIAGTPWADRAHLHVSDEGGRLDLAASLTGAGDGTHVYCCGPDGYMEAVGSAARGAGLPEDAIHTEYFAVPEAPDWENSPFRVTLARSGRTVDVDADTPLSDALIAAGVPVDVKCADGLCGVCQCGVIEGNVEHRDYVLSRAERETRMITCQSRAAEAGGTLILDL
ncbi:MAG: 2Fe-2S iron-sulfur cluster-binding protein, partial [Pseudomonadota bacterium]